MTNRIGLIYEITYSIDPDSVEAFDGWLDSRMHDTLAVAGGFDCQVFSTDGEPERATLRVCQLRFASDDALEHFLDNVSAALEANLVERFADRVTTSARVFRQDQIPGQPSENPDCMNCGTRLRGQYCGTCGQRSRSRLISIWELVRDAFGDLFEIDSRLWKTLIPLLIRPGRLTHDYLQGRRARYMPPFRSYLVLSLVFFVVAFFDPREKLGLLFAPTAAPASSDEQAEADHQRNEALGELAEQGVILGGGLPEDTAEQPDGINLRIGSDANPAVQCNIDSFSVDGLPGWLARRLTPERLQHVCLRARIDNGRALVDNLLETIPAALIVLLPIMALVLKTLYPLSRRYYVEHLLFFVHFHAFFFLILTLQVLFTRLSTMLAIPGAITTVVITTTVIYVPVYLFIGMRRVYGQGRLITSFKYVALLTAYVIGLVATMLGALAIAAFSI